jgi:hypothetical protein
MSLHSDLVGRVIWYINDLVRIGGNRIMMYPYGKYVMYMKEMGKDEVVLNIARYILEDGWHPYYYKYYEETGDYMKWYIFIMSELGFENIEFEEEAMEHFRENFIVIFRQ